MDVAGFIALLARSDLDVTPLEVAETLWLAGYATSPPGEGTGQAREPREDPATPGEEPGIDTGTTTGEPGAALPLYVPQALRPGPHTGTTADLPGTPIPVPASTALPHSLALMRALRPLKLRAPDASRRTLDTDSTIDASARAGALMPVLRDATERRFSLALVTDTGPAMAVWAKLEAELFVALQRLAAFRDLQRWYLHTDSGRVLGVSQSTRAGQALREPAELLDPAGRRLILFLTDGAGSAWYSGAMARTLRLWGAGGPVAILQPLPQQLWQLTPLKPVRGRLTATRQAAPNAELEFSPHIRAARWRRMRDAARKAAESPPVPIPVLELGADWLRGWARLVSGTQGTAMDCTVTLAAAGPSSEAPPVPSTQDTTAEERVRNFAEQASPQAQRLASYLAAAPLSLPVIRLVQQVMLPGSGPSHLAEVLLGGLVATHGVPGVTNQRQRWRYEFQPGVRDLLLNGLGRADARRVLTAVSRELNARFGRGADEFTAVAGIPGTGQDIASTQQLSAPSPFAEISAHVLERITGTFATATSRQPAPEATILIRRYQRTGAITDIDAAITELRRKHSQSFYAERAVATPPSAREAVEVELAAALQARYLSTGEPADLDEAIDILRRAGPPPEVLEPLATALGLRHARNSSPADLDEALRIALAGAGVVSRSAPEFGRLAALIGLLLLRRGAASDLGNAITWLQLAADAPLPAEARARALTDLSIAHRRTAEASPRFTESRRQDLSEAVSSVRRAIELCGTDEDELYGLRAREQAARYAVLGAALQDNGDAAGAAAGYQRAVELAPPFDPATGEYLAGWGVALRESGSLADAVRRLREAIGETLPEDPASVRLQIELANTLLARYLSEGHPGDLIEARYVLEPTLDTLSGRLSLARVLAAEGRREEARAILTDVLPVIEPEHPDYQVARDLEEML